MFHVSNGWVQKYLNRHGLSVRRKTTQSQKEQERLVEKLAHFVLKVRRLRNQHSYVNQNIIAMDDTAVWLDMISGKTVDVCTRPIRMKTTGNEKSKVSVCLTANADGKGLKPFIVFTGEKREVKELNEHFIGNVFLRPHATVG